MKITLNRYLIKEQIVPLSVCLFGLTIILVTGRLLQLTRYLFTSSVTVLDLLQLVIFALPKLMLFALPMAVLLGTLLAFLRLNGDNELVALRSAGIGFSQLIPSIVCVTLVATVLAFYNSLILVPPAGSAFENKLRSLGRAGLPALLKEGTFIDTIPKMVFFFRSVDTSNMSIEGVFLQDQRQAKVRAAIVAERAQIVYQKDLNHLIFRISNGIITRISDDFKDAQAISFKLYDLTLSLDDLYGAAAKRSQKGKREMTLLELYHLMQQGAKTKPEVSFALEFHQRLAFPISCLLFGLMGASLGSMFRQRGRMTGITIGLIVFLTYYIALSAGKGLGENRLLPPFFAIWTPNILCLFVSIYLCTKVQRETPFHLAHLWHQGDAFLRRILTANRFRKPTGL
ncbi:MAG: LptF/LptG family permease [Syntrophobacteraceae bacterium]|nr:LptF/LptG family permease [Desulfobacteraceae bacterium]